MFRIPQGYRKRAEIGSILRNELVEERAAVLELEFITRTHTHEHDTQHHQNTPDKNQYSGTFGIEDRPHEDAAKESQGYVYAEDPSGRAVAVVA